MNQPSKAIMAWIDILRRHGWDDDEILDDCTRKWNLNLHGRRLVQAYLTGHPVKQLTPTQRELVEPIKDYIKTRRRKGWKTPSAIEIAAQFGIHEKTVRRWKKDGVI